MGGYIEWTCPGTSIVYLSVKALRHIVVGPDGLGRRGSNWPQCWSSFLADVGSSRPPHRAIFVGYYLRVIRVIYPSPRESRGVLIVKYSTKHIIDVHESLTGSTDYAHARAQSRGYNTYSKFSQMTRMPAEAV
jgi:hypothetical protein